MSIITREVFFFFLPFPTNLVGSRLLIEDACIIRGFCRVSRAETKDRRGCTGEKRKKKLQDSRVLVGEVGGGVFDVVVSWRHITHFDIS